MDGITNRPFCTVHTKETTQAHVLQRCKEHLLFFPLVWWHIMQQSETWTQSTKLSCDFEQKLVTNTHFYQLNLELSHLCSLTDLCDHTFHFSAVNNCQHFDKCGKICIYRPQETAHMKFLRTKNAPQKNKI